MQKLILTSNKKRIQRVSSHKQIDTGRIYKIVISQDFTGLCNQLWTIVSGIITCIKENKHILLIDRFLLNVHTNSYCPVSHILNLPDMNIFLQKYNLTLFDYVRFDTRKMLNIKSLPWFDWKAIQDPDNDSLKREIYQNIRFAPSVVYPALNFISGILNRIKKSTINVIHLRIEQDWLDHVSSCRSPGVSSDVVYNEISTNYIELIQKYIMPNELTFVLTGSTDNRVIDYLHSNRYAYALFPKITPYREKNAAMDMVIGAQCNNVFIGCGGSSFSDILMHRIVGEKVRQYLC